MRHLFDRWTSNNQPTIATANSHNSLATTIYLQHIPMIEEEESGDEGSFLFNQIDI